MLKSNSFCLTFFSSSEKKNNTRMKMRNMRKIKKPLTEGPSKMDPMKNPMLPEAKRDVFWMSSQRNGTFCTKRIITLYIREVIKSANHGSFFRLKSCKRIFIPRMNIGRLNNHISILSNRNKRKKLKNNKKIPTVRFSIEILSKPVLFLVNNSFLNGILISKMLMRR